MQFPIFLTASVLATLFSASTAAPTEFAAAVAVDNDSLQPTNATIAELEKRLGWAITVYKNRGCTGSSRDWTGGSLPKTNIPLGGNSFKVTKTSDAGEAFSTYSGRKQKGSCYFAGDVGPGCCVSVPFASMMKTWGEAEVPDWCAGPERDDGITMTGTNCVG
jgi:hypothetical protein